MKFDGKAIADAMIEKLAGDVREKNLNPTIAVLLVGDNPESLAYIRQKQKAVERIGGKFIFEQLPKTISQKELSARIDMYNRDNTTHGLVVQRPMPKGLTARVIPKKDIDGLETDSHFEIPIAMAVFTVLKNITIQQKNIVIIGRGETAGKPIAAAFAKKQCATSIIHSKTSNPNEILKTADIIVSCVGKEKVVTGDAIKPGAILISVGLWRDDKGKLHGDYEEEEVKNIASMYTPTPGGIGPVNIACLIQNLVKAASHVRPE